MGYTPTFAISLINTQNGHGLIDCGTTDLKTARGGARNWYKNLGHMLDSWLAQQNAPYSVIDGGEHITIIMRPITVKDDAIAHNIHTGINAKRYIAREISHGATTLTMDDLF